MTEQLHYQNKRVEAFVFGKSSLSSLDSISDSNERKIAEREFVAKSLNLPIGRVILLDQVHGFDCVRIGPHDLPCTNTLFTKADGLVTTEKNVALVIRTADCLPVFMYAQADDLEAENGGAMVGLLHAGWRGLVKGLIPHSIGMALHLKDRAKHEKIDLGSSLYFHAGPYIPGSKYQVGFDVSSHFPLSKKDESNVGKAYLDLYENARWLIGETMMGKNVEFDDPFNVVENNDNLYEQFYSHRRGEAGRNLNVIRIVG